MLDWEMPTRLALEWAEYSALQAERRKEADLEARARQNMESARKRALRR